MKATSDSRWYYKLLMRLFRVFLPIIRPLAKMKNTLDRVQKIVLVVFGISLGLALDSVKWINPHFFGYIALLLLILGLALKGMQSRVAGDLFILEFGFASATVWASTQFGPQFFATLAGITLFILIGFILINTILTLSLASNRLSRKD